MNKDSRRLVLGAAVGYGRDDIRVFVESLRASGYAGDAVLYVSATAFDLMRYLRTRGVRPIPVMNIRRIYGPIHSRRIAWFISHLEKCEGRYDQVMTSDIRDVAFQANPFDRVEGAGCQFYLEAAPHTIGANRHNAHFMQTFLSAEQADKLASQRITCCGVIIGGAPAMLAYLRRVRDLMTAIPFSKRHKIGADTAFHALLAYVEPAPGSAIVENNRHVATVGLERQDRYRIEADGRISVDGGFVPPIVHQYDRHPAMIAALRARYA